MKLLQMCSVKLIYLGDLKFGVLKWKPCPPKTKPTKTKLLPGKIPQFNIVEEYTIDDSPPENVPIDLTKTVMPPPSPAVVTCDTSVSSLQNEQTLDTYVQNESGELPVETNTPASTIKLHQASTMYTRTYNSFRRVTIEAADCEINSQNIRGDILITVEPKDELYNNNNASTAGRTQQTLTQPLSNTLPNVNAIAQALQMNGIAVDTDPQPSTSSDSVSPTREDPIHDPNSPLSPEQTTSVAPPRQIPLEPKTVADAETQTYVPGFRHITEFIFSAEFQHNLATCRCDFEEKAYDQIRKQPMRQREWFLHVLNRFPGLIADNGPFLGGVVRTPNIEQEPLQLNQDQVISLQPPVQATPRDQSPPPRTSTGRPKPIAHCSRAPQAQQQPLKNKAQRKETPPPVEEPSLSDTSTIAYTNSPQTDPDIMLMEKPPTPGGSTMVYDNKRGSQHYTVTRTPDFDQVTAQADIHNKQRKRKRDK